MERYYFSTHGSDVQGPISAEMLRHLQASGALSDDTQIRLEGSDTWRKITPLVTPKKPSVQSAPLPNAPDRSKISEKIATSRSSSGRALVIIGLIIAGYFYFLFDTSVQVESHYISGYGTIGGGRVNNLGLMQDRTLGCGAGLAIAIVGAIMIASDKQKKT